MIYKWIQSHEEQVTFERSKKLIIIALIVTTFGISDFLRMLCTLSGKSSKVILTASLEPNLGALYLRTMSVRVADTMKYCCFKRNSFPSKN